MLRALLRRIARRVLGPMDTPDTPPLMPVEEPTTSSESDSVEVDATQVAAWLRAGEDVHFLDVREPHELRRGFVPETLFIPMNQVPHRLDEIPCSGKLIVYCAAGARSYGVVNFLRQHDFGQSWSLIGGLGAWAAEPEGECAQPPSEAVALLGSTVRIEGSTLLGLGVVQEVRNGADGPRYAVAVRGDGGEPVVLRDLRSEQLVVGTAG